MVEINLVGESKARAGSAAKRAGCLGFGGILVVILTGLVVVWTGLH